MCVRMSHVTRVIESIIFISFTDLHLTRACAQVCVCVYA